MHQAFDRIKRAVACGLALVVSACSSGGPAAPLPQQVSTASFALDVNRTVQGLATKQNKTWQDGSVSTIRSLKDYTRAHQDKVYHVATAGLTSSLLLPSACSSYPSYLKLFPDDTTGPNPKVGEFLYEVLDNGTIEKINPTTMTLVSSFATGFPVSKSGVSLSGDNRRIYIISTNGQFIIEDAVNLGAPLYSKKISASGFAGQVPFVDYGLNTSGGTTIFGSIDHVFALSTDGSLYCVTADQHTGTLTTTVNAWTSSNGTDKGTVEAAWTTPQASLPYGATVAPGASAVLWQGTAYFGTKTGTFYTVKVNPASPGTAGTVKSWLLSAYTSGPAANGMGCSAPVSLDYDDTTLAVTEIFAPCGDRVCWIDATSGAVYASPSLAVDKIPGSAAQYQGALSAFPYTSTTQVFTDYDWASVAALNNPTPTRWGSGGAVAGTFSTGISCATIKKEPATGNVWIGLYNTSGAGGVGQVQSLTPGGTVNGTFDSSAADVNEIAFDPAGNCYAAHGSSNKIAKFNSAGTLLTSYTYPGGSALWPQPDPSGQLWCTGASGGVTRFTAAGTVQGGFPVACPGAFAIACDAGNNALVCTNTSPGKVYKFTSAGATVAGFPVTVGNTATYVAIEPGTNNIWTCNEGSNTVSRLTPAGANLPGSPFTVPSQPWCIAFDNSGDPWVGCVGAKNVNKLDVNTGAVLATYAVPGGGQPFELAFDGNGTCWASASNGTYKFFDLGDLSDMFATDGFATTGDGDDSLNFMKFRITKGAFAGKIPIGATITVTNATTPATGPTESYSLYRTSPYLANLTTLWQGWGAAINMDFSTRSPLIDSFPYATLSGVTPVKDTSQTFNLGTRAPTDSLNSSDGTYAEWSYGFRATGKALGQAAHFYSNSTAPVTASKPTLTVTMSTTALPTTSGLLCQPCVDIDFGRVYVSNSNCVFELPYDPANPTDFSDSTKVYYNLTKAGRTGGPVSASKFIVAVSDIQQNFYGDLFVTDADTSGKLFVNRFSRQFYTSPSTDHLQASFNGNPVASAATLSQGELWDYDKGSVYFATSNNYLVRGTLY